MLRSEPAPSFFFPTRASALIYSPDPLTRHWDFLVLGGVFWVVYLFIPVHFKGEVTHYSFLGVASYWDCTARLGDYNSVFRTGPRT